MEEGKPQPQPQAPQEIDDGLYSRQRYALGEGGMARLQRAKVFVGSSDGLAAEVAKNVALLGVELLTLHSEPSERAAPFSDTADGSVGVLTDTGYVTDQAADLLSGVDLAVLEANHDVETLRSGPYPYYLKKRILGLEGHLSNGDAGAFAALLAERGASEIVLAHLSRENNTPAMARTAVETALAAAGAAPVLSVAPRDTLGPAHVLVRRAVCRR